MANGLRKSASSSGEWRIVGWIPDPPPVPPERVVDEHGWWFEPGGNDPETGEWKPARRCRDTGFGAAFCVVLESVGGGSSPSHPSPTPGGGSSNENNNTVDCNVSNATIPEGCCEVFVYYSNGGYRDSLGHWVDGYWTLRPCV